MTRDEFVMENAIKIPADTKSSKYVKGTNVAIIVDITPAKNVPFAGKPRLISEKKLGNNPSRASAYCNRGCNNTDSSTTIGNVTISPAYTHSYIPHKERNEKINKPIRKKICNTMRIIQQSINQSINQSIHDQMCIILVFCVLTFVKEKLTAVNCAAHSILL